MICDMCQNYCYDEEFEEYYCDINLDEDEYLRFLSTVTETKCPYFKNHRFSPGGKKKKATRGKRDALKKQ
ncbi:MAG: hypothetical protein IIY01_06710 [Clostridia bacterium]|nr:hypothetical protein [Clostridia bacterium]